MVEATPKAHQLVPAVSLLQPARVASVEASEVDFVAMIVVDSEVGSAATEVALEADEAVSATKEAAVSPEEVGMAAVGALVMALLLPLMPPLDLAAVVVSTTATQDLREGLQRMA